MVFEIEMRYMYIILTVQTTAQTSTCPALYMWSEPKPCTIQPASITQILRVYINVIGDSVATEVDYDFKFQVF